ncbi:hypothetical protein [Altererythrobacter sp. B11]|uniref:hypothetical protein n=1 Tax=Altererythrobacter sp. B11 TaxID=2060312 RepID=UPI000E5ABC38|nr:hypothetical protein [Altererythrobacter sp. B11]
MRTLTLASAAALALLSACSSGEEANPEAGASATATDAATPPGAASSLPGASPTVTMLTLDGLGDLTIGAPVPETSSFAQHGAQAPGSSCTIATSPDYPGVEGMVEVGQLRRIAVSQGSSVQLMEGIGAGSTEEEVRAAFPGFREEPHKYEEAPAKYLTQPGEDPRLRFEIGRDGKVRNMFVGVMPQLAYVESCG